MAPVAVAFAQGTAPASTGDRPVAIVVEPPLLNLGFGDDANVAAFQEETAPLPAVAAAQEWAEANATHDWAADLPSEGDSLRQIRSLRLLPPLPLPLPRPEVAEESVSKRRQSVKWTAELPAPVAPAAAVTTPVEDSALQPTRLLTPVAGMVTGGLESAAGDMVEALSQPTQAAAATTETASGVGFGVVVDPQASKPPALFGVAPSAAEASIGEDWATEFSGDSLRYSIAPASLS